MARRVVATGRRRAGKSSFTALVSRYLKHSTLLVDLDPDISLADMFRFDFHRESYRLQK